MNSEKDFKDALKDKLNEKQFQFDEAAWEKASQMLDATREEKKKRPFPYFLAAGILLILSLIGFYILKPTKGANEISSANIASENTEIKNNETAIAEVKKVASKTTQANSSLLEGTTTAATKKEIEKTETTNTENENDAVVKTKTSSSKKQKIRAEKEIFKNAIAVNVAKKGNTKTAKTDDQKQDEVAVIQTLETKAEEDVFKENPLIPVEEIKADELTTALSVLPVNVRPVKEPVTYIELPKNMSETKNNTQEPVHFVSFETGVSYLFGWNNPGKKDASGVNPVVGLNYYNVSKPITFSFGIHYTMVRNLSYSSHTVTTTRYNFGEESDVMIFTPTTMHYLTAPIRIGYSVNSKNTFGLGYNVGYLFNLNSNVELYAQTAGKKGNATILKTSGYTQGFKTIDQQISIFYRRNLAKDLWLNAEFMYGLTDVKDNKFFNSNVFERNTGVKVTLIYNLFKK